MFNKFIISGLVFACVGCSSLSDSLIPPAANLQLSQKSVSSVLELQALPLENDKAVTIQIQNDSQKFNTPDINSTVALYKIPTNGQELTLEVTSYFNRTFFAPSVRLFDDKGLELADIPFGEFSFQDRDFFNSYRKEFVKPIVPPHQTEAIYVLIYTTNDDAQGSSPLRVMSERYGEETITIDHAYNGLVSVKYTQAQKVDVSSLKLTSSEELPIVETQPTPEPSVAVPSKSSSTSKTKQSSETKQTKAVSVEALRELIEQGDTQQALELLNEVNSIQ